MYLEVKWRSPGPLSTQPLAHGFDLTNTNEKVGSVDPEGGKSIFSVNCNYISLDVR